ncbi:MAG: hypothetical protein M3119_02410 [Verrucomicrobiota bacterium]|nr:hypothetical protein [Verrucomicrobiota bacterium]
MRVFICLLIGVAVVGGFLAHRQKNEPAPAPIVARQENSPHKWMKNSLDRTAEVKKQVAQQRKESGDIYGR